MKNTVLELQKGKVNVAVGAGPFKGNLVAHCEADGELEITWDDDTTTTYTMTTGSDVEIRDAQMKEVSVVSGTFTIMNY